MKISSVSKKVLASALSAAMVVAFAPTVAFGNGTATPGSKVTVNFYGGAGQLQTGHAPILPQDLTVDSNGQITIAAVDNSAYKYNGSTITGWVLDANGNQQADDGEAPVTIASAIDINNGTTVMDLVAVYTSVSASNAAILGGLTAEGATGDAAPTVKFGEDTDKAGKVKASTKYTVALTNEAGAVLGQAVHTTKASEYGFTVTAADFPTIKKSAITPGKYTFALYEGTDLVGSKDVTICKLILDNSAGYRSYAQDAATTYYIEKGAASGTVSVPTIGAAGAYTFGGYTSADASVSGAANGALSGTVKGDTVLVAAYNNPQVNGVAFNGTQISWTAANMDTVNSANLTVEVSGPVSRTYTVTNTNGADTTGHLVFSNYQDGQASTGNADCYYKGTPASGTYTVKVTQNFTEASGKASKVIGSASVSISSITYDVGEGVDAGDPTKPFDTSALVAAIQTGTTLTTTQANAINAAAPAVKSTSLNSFSKWTIDGKAVSNATKITGDTVVKAVYVANKIDAPTYTVEANGKNFDIAFVAPEGVTLTYTAGGNTYKILSGTKVTFDPTVGGQQTVVATATKDGKTGTVTLKAAAAVAGKTVTNLETEIKNILNTATTESTATKAQTYNSIETVKETLASGTAAYKAIGYAKDAEWTDAYASNVKATLEAVVAAETENLAAYKAGVAQADGSVKKIADEVYAKAVADMAVAVADYYAVNDSDNTTKASTGSAVTTSASAVTEIQNIVKAAEKTATTYAAADVTAAKAVSDAIAAAKTAAEAKAALAAYEALTAEQKNLVDPAGVIAAQEIVAAAELKDAQDDAAVSKARSASKTVKAGKNGKTTKKQSVTLKAITSKSGAKVTYKKSSGSSKVSVKSGKAYLAKGVKKGTYKATVKATCGTQTAKITVKFTVKA